MPIKYRLKSATINNMVFSSETSDEYLNPGTREELDTALDLAAFRFLGRPSCSDTCIAVASTLDSILAQAYENGVVEKQYTTRASASKRTLTIVFRDPDTGEQLEHLPKKNED